MRNGRLLLIEEGRWITRNFDYIAMYDRKGRLVRTEVFQGMLVLATGSGKRALGKLPVEGPAEKPWRKVHWTFAAIIATAFAETVIGFFVLLR